MRLITIRRLAGGLPLLVPVRVSAHRSLGAYRNVFSIESFMDELAEAAGADPVAFRLRHLTDERARAVIQEAATRYGWPSPGADPAPGMGRGSAFPRYKNLGAYCALALDLHVEHETGAVRLGRIVAAVDSGQPVNPDGIRNQIEGAIVQSASWTLYQLDALRVRPLRPPPHHQHRLERLPHPPLPRRPRSIEVHIMDRPGQPFLGTGEAGQGPTAAAIANAIRDATGQRLRGLPFSASTVKAAIGV